MLLSLVAVFSSCESETVDRFEGKYLVIYDGNGGFLGNKTAQVRKLYCNPDSKLPGYYTDYVDSRYTVSSLGLAIRAGYSLKGWYVNGTESYTADVNGTFVKLDIADGNGIYDYDENGSFVHKYLETENGQYVFISVDDSDNAGAQYVYIDMKDYPDSEASIETGFRVLRDEYASDSEEEIYIAAKGVKVYSKSDVDAVKGYQIYADLADDIKALVADYTRYDPAFTAYDAETDDGLDRYELVTGYADINNIMVLDAAGAYVVDDNKIELYTDGSAGDRYSINEKYVFVSTDSAPTPSYLDRYKASYKYWNFEQDRVTADVVQDGVLTLSAHWVKKYTVVFDENNGIEGAVHTLTTKLGSDRITYYDIEPGITINKWGMNPAFAGHTFVCWSKTKDVYDPWDFDNDVYPEGTNELVLYAYYLEGTYTLINNASDLKKIAANPAGQYLITADIDLGGASYPKKSGEYPTGLKTGDTFTGKLISLSGSKISNFTITKKPANSLASIFPKVSGEATLDGYTAEYTVKSGSID